jgi:chaperonin GroEL
MIKALPAPLLQILENAGVTDWMPTQKMGMDVKTGEEGDMIKMGIIDPTKVTISALQNAVSVAVTILSTNAIVTMARSYESK